MDTVVELGQSQSCKLGQIIQKNYKKNFDIRFGIFVPNWKNSVKLKCFDNETKVIY